MLLMSRWQPSEKVHQRPQSNESLLEWQSRKRHCQTPSNKRQRKTIIEWKYIWPFASLCAGIRSCLPSTLFACGCGICYFIHIFLAKISVLSFSSWRPDAIRAKSKKTAKKWEKSLNEKHEKKKEKNSTRIIPSSGKTKDVIIQLIYVNNLLQGRCKCIFCLF